MVYAVTDLETIGGSTKSTKITEISIFLTDGEKIIDEYTRLVNPEQPIPYFITGLTGINNEMVQDAPKFYEIAKEIIEFIGDAVFVAHNVGFDYNVLRHEYKSLGFDFRKPHLCTVRSSRKVIPGYSSYSLGKLTDQLGIAIEGRHRARGDALATAKLFHLIYQKDENNLASFLQNDVIPQHLHPGLDLSIIEDIPKKVGIYKFYNEEHQLIYIGKSKNIQSRVKQHLKSKTSKKAFCIAKEIAHIETELTGSETIALIHESSLIKKHQPRFNQRLKKDRYPFGLYSYEDGNAAPDGGQGYINLHIDQVKNKNTPPMTTFFNKKEAVNYLEKMVEDHQLCKKLLGLYPTKSSCFGYQTKQCKGACIGEESPKSYNKRVQEMFNHLQFDLKNFYLIDTGRSRSEISLILVERGSFIGYGFLPQHLHNSPLEKWKEYIVHYQEDRDIRMIIKRIFRIKKEVQIRNF